MAVKGGDFFVNLGLKGNDKTKSDLDSLDKSFKGLESSALAAKLSILGVFYGLEKIISTSGALGTVLAQFAAVSGMNTGTVQRYSLAGEPYGVTQQETLGQFKSIKDEMIGAKFNAQDLRPFTLAMFGILQEHGIRIDTSPDALSQLAQHPEQMFGYEQAFANLKDVPLTERTAILDQRGVSDEQQNAYLNNAYSQSNLDKQNALVLSAETIKRDYDASKMLAQDKQIFNKGLAEVGALLHGKGDNEATRKQEEHELYSKAHSNILGNVMRFLDPSLSHDKHLVHHVTNNHTAITHTSHISLVNPDKKDIPALKKAVSTDHADLVSLTTSAHQPR